MLGNLGTLPQSWGSPAPPPVPLGAPLSGEYTEAGSGAATIFSTAAAATGVGAAIGASATGPFAPFGAAIGAVVGAATGVGIHLKRRSESKKAQEYEGYLQRVAQGQVAHAQAAASKFEQEAAAYAEGRQRAILLGVAATIAIGLPAVIYLKRRQR